jgi:hypothetical protein
MLDQNIGMLESDSRNLRRKQAQPMLDLFEADCGREAITLDEIKEWASAQQDGKLQLRIERLVSARLSRHNKWPKPLVRAFRQAQRDVLGAPPVR